jgi:SAM-dependent methyltransferase
MNLIEYIASPADHDDLWHGSYKIPWDEPSFSRRMLAEHLSDTHDMASRRSFRIDAHAAWIHDDVLAASPSRVLDIACGPGLYTSRLAKLGHECTGIDFAPASIEYAQEHVPEGTQCSYILGDVRTVEYGSGYDLATIIFGELNVFPIDECETILRKMHAALGPGGQVLIEAHTFDTVSGAGQGGPSWYATDAGLFSDRPHICLTENHWHADTSVARTCFSVIDADTAEVTRYSNTVQAYTDDEYRALLTRCGFGRVELARPWGVSVAARDREFVMIRAWTD